MPFDRYGKELHELTEAKAGKTTANVTFWLILIATWVVALTVIVGAMVLVTKLLFPYVATLPRLPLAQMGNVVLSFAIAVAVVTFAGVKMLKMVRRTRDIVVRVIGTRLDELTTEVSGTIRRVDELSRVSGDAAERVRYLESRAANVTSVNDALGDLHTRLVPLERLPEDVQGAESIKEQLITKMLLSAVSAVPVGHPLIIVSARYGVNSGKTIDVQDLLTDQIKFNRIRMKVTNKTMGKDPQYGAEKVLRVVYDYDNVEREVVVNEGDELSIPD